MNTVFSNVLGKPKVIIFKSEGFSETKKMTRETRFKESTHLKRLGEKYKNPKKNNVL